MSIHRKLRFLLLQVRDPEDPIRLQERACFERVLNCQSNQISTCDLLSHVTSANQLARTDCVLIGGSGRYSATASNAWLDRSFDLLRDLVETSKPTFASCWGFQAMARALGGRLVTDLARAELGTLKITLTREGRNDEVFGAHAVFPALLGHEDIVDELPSSVVRLASSDVVLNQAFKVQGKPIYATQFHPELTVDEFVERVGAYPEYVHKIAGMSVDEFISTCRATPHANSLLRRFVNVVC